jgi:hypothetical protein
VLHGLFVPITTGKSSKSAYNVSVKRRDSIGEPTMINLDPEFTKELRAIYEASGLLHLARKRLKDAQELGDTRETKLQSGAVEAMEQHLQVAYATLGRAIFEYHQRVTGEYPKVE